MEISDTEKYSAVRPAGKLTGGKEVYKVQSVRHLTDSTYVLRVDRLEMPAIAGQCATVGVLGSGINREYSLYSGNDDPYFEFLIKEIEGGQVSGALKTCVPGDEVELDGPYGQFILHNPEDLTRRYLFIGTGVGIAPFHGFVGSYPEIDYKIIHGVRHLEERYDMDSYDRSRYVSCVSRGAGGDFSGRVTDYLRAYPVDKDFFCYLCGNSEMVGEVFDLLRSQGVDGDHLFTEAFF